MARMISYFAVRKFNILEFTRKEIITGRLVGSTNSKWNIVIISRSEMKMAILPAQLDESVVCDRRLSRIIGSPRKTASFRCTRPYHA